MKTTIAAIILFTFLSTSYGTAPSINDVNCLSNEDMVQLIESHTITLSEKHCEKLLQIIDTLDSNSAEPFQELATQLRQQREKVSLQKLSLFQEIDLKKHLGVFRELSKYQDISLKFFSLLIRIKNYDTSASKELKQLIADKTLSIEDRRLLKTECVETGLDIVNDTAQDIYDQIQMLYGDLKPKIGQKAPPFEITDINGNTVSLEKYKGKPVLLHFWATWCGPCMFELDRLNSYLREMIEEDKIVVIGISVDDNEDKFKAAIKKHNLNWIHNFEGKGLATKLVRLYKVNSFPRDYVIDKNGIVISYNYQDLHKDLAEN